jgi:GNAT superfamily N-acetyltransferase
VQLFLRANFQGNAEEVPYIDAMLQDAREATRNQVQGKVAHSTTYVIVSEGERVGRLRVVRPAQHIEIAGLQVLPTHQRRGIGTAVIRAILDEGTTQGPSSSTCGWDSSSRARHMLVS